MKTLYLLRHAHTIPAAAPLMGDYERVLSSRGTADALAVGQFMQEHDMYPDFVLSSSAVRTIQTARLIFGVLFRREGVRVRSHFDRQLYAAPVEKLLREIHAIDQSINRLLVVAHNPGVSDLAVTLDPTGTESGLGSYDPCTLSVFSAACADWAHFLPEITRLERVLKPQH